MWAGVVFVLLAGTPFCQAEFYAAYHYYETNRDEEDGDFYDIYVDETDTAPTLMTSPMEVVTRIRRFEEGQEIRTLAPQEVQFVKGALKEMLYGHNLARLTRTAFTKSPRIMSWAYSPTHSKYIPLRRQGGVTTPALSLEQNMSKLHHISRAGVTNIPSVTLDAKAISKLSASYSAAGQTIPAKLKDKLLGVAQKGKAAAKYTGEPTTASPKMDIDAIIAIIANLTYDYDWNLTEQFNKTLIDHGVPTCPTESTLTTTTTTPSPYDFSNSSVVSKCFVCGLKELEIPRTAFCADAFAGDFLPLVPTDPRARGKIATYRKYCRYLDVHNYVENPLESRSIYGRFTGGCGVRWTDLTGIYTQRTCRARFRPMMGKHFASKRMAKLELALVNVENGCIISPMASLLPLSRGISLYARFHACVCTGSWCNRARMRTRTLRTAILFYWLAFMASILV